MTNATTSKPAGSSWGAALADLGLDHPALMRFTSTRTLLEDGHRVHEQRRSLEGRLHEALGLVETLRREFDEATDEGLRILAEVQAEVQAQTADLNGIVDRLQDRLAVPVDPSGETPSDASFVERHGLREQYDELLDMYASFGLFDARSRSIRFQGDRGRVQQMPTFEALMSVLLTDEIRSYLMTARRVSLIVAPVTDQRVFAAVGKSVSFGNFAGTSDGAEGGGACVEFVDRLRTSSGSESAAESLLRSTPFDGLRVSLFAEEDQPNSELRAAGYDLDATMEDIALASNDAADRGVSARPLSPVEYLVVQATRGREGQPLLDRDQNTGPRTETWFPDHQLAGAQGTLVARLIRSGVRFRSVELPRGVEGRGYRMTYAPLAA